MEATGNKGIGAATGVMTSQVCVLGPGAVRPEEPKSTGFPAEAAAAPCPGTGCFQRTGLKNLGVISCGECLSSAVKYLLKQM